jgi:hypothetical protein
MTSACCLHNFQTATQSRSYVTTDSHSAGLFLCQAPIWSLRPDFYYCQTVADLLMLIGPVYNIFARTAQKTSPSILLYSLVAVERCFLAEPLLAMAVVQLLVSRSLPNNGSTCHNIYSISLLHMPLYNLMYLMGNKLVNNLS